MVRIYLVRLDFDDCVHIFLANVKKYELTVHNWYKAIILRKMSQSRSPSIPNLVYAQA